MSQIDFSHFNYDVDLMPAKSSEATHGALVSESEPFRLKIRVYYEDTDFSGLVYHASYLRFLERGRTEFLRSLGIEHNVIFAGGGTGGFHFVVRAMTIDFLKPALMDDEICVETITADIGGASIEMAQKIRRGQDLLLTAKVRIAVVAGGRARRIPSEILMKFKPTPIAVKPL
jgi:acyl-CoA thioester hydrolase